MRIGIKRWMEWRASPSQLVLEDIVQEGQACHVEEPSDAVLVDTATWEGPRALVYAPWYVWCLEVHFGGKKGMHNRRLLL